MSCSFWNMRRRLKAQQQKDKLVTNFAQSQPKLEVETPTTEVKPRKRAVKKVGDKNDGRTSNNA